MAYLLEFLFWLSNIVIKMVIFNVLLFDFLIVILQSKSSHYYGFDEPVRW
jgi:hypothetical protein